MKKEEIEKMLLKEFKGIYPKIFKSLELKEKYIEIKDSRGVLYGIPYRSGLEDFMNDRPNNQKMLIYSVFISGEFPNCKL